jgi:hypothetical protein
MKYIVGAYATAPSLALDDMALEQNYYEMLIQEVPEIRGLEIPFWGDDIHIWGCDFLLKFIQPTWDNVLTCVPASVMGLKKNKYFGLASNDETSRLEAIKSHRKANDIVHKINDFFGRQSFIAIQLATAPTVPVDGVNSSLESLLKSMNEIISWDWQGAKILIEHCDSFVDNPIQKGFMSIDEEIRALLSLADKTNIGLSINWARSAIEGRSSERVIEHINKVNKHQLLSGLIFSGTTINDEQYGEWTDLHMPFAQSYEIQNYEKNSLLTRENIKNTLSSVNLSEIDYLGFKLLAMPINEAPLVRRLGINKDAATVLNHLLAELNNSLEVSK